MLENFTLGEPEWNQVHTIWEKSGATVYKFTVVHVSASLFVGKVRGRT
jgi:hypothetical protein